MTSITDLAKTAYEAFRAQQAQTGRVGGHLQPWEQMPGQFQAGWIAAAQAMRAAMDNFV